MLKTTSDRLNLAVLYLHFLRERPKILEQTTLAAILGKTPARTKNLLPSVKLGVNDGFDMLLFEEVAADDFAETSFSFERTGH
jgi:hypothetical protein